MDTHFSTNRIDPVNNGASCFSLGHFISRSIGEVFNRYNIANETDLVSAVEKATNLHHESREKLKRVAAGHKPVSGGIDTCVGQNVTH